ncbi:MAG: hypothetical protein AAF411_26510 [Myxococcota bacterium]
MGLAVAALLSACAGSPAQPAAPTSSAPKVSYAITFDANLLRARVRACFTGFRPRVLRRVTAGAERLWVPDPSFPQQLAMRRARIEIRRPLATGCVHYGVDLARDAGDQRALLRMGDELLVSPGVLLWRPAVLPEGLETRVSIDATGYHVSTSWPEGPVDASLYRYAGNIALTRAAPARYDEGGLTVEVARFIGELDASAAELERWLRVAVQSAQTIGGRFPTTRLHVVIVPLGAGRSPVAFGLVRRGGGASVLLFPHQNASGDALMRDWVAIHELSHLTVPRLDGDRWLSEGYATYMQEYLRMRLCLFTPQQGLQRMRDRFVTNRLGAGMPLAEESDAMSRTGSFAHVYWCGAAFFLELDIALHRRGTSLAAIVDQQPREGPMGYDGAQWLEAFDATIGAPLAVPLMHRYGRYERIPDPGPIFDALGVRLEDERVVLLPEGEGAELRRRLFGETVDADAPRADAPAAPTNERDARSRSREAGRVGR